MEKTEFNFTKANLEALSIPAPGKRIVVRDTKQPGLQLRVTANGVKTFSVRRRRKGGADERITLDKLGKMSIEQARAKAASYVAELGNGRSVAEIQRDAKGEHTFSKLFAEYITRHAKQKKRTWREDEAKFQTYLARPLGSKRLSEIERRDIGAIHSRITNAEHPTTANRVLSLISSVFGKAIEWGLYDRSNPCAGIKKNKETARKRFLQADELPRFFAALAAEQNDTIRDYLLMSLLTGARRTNVLEMKWRDISMGRAEWEISRTKNGDAQTINLVGEAMEILTTRRDTARQAQNDSPFVFPGVGVSGHLEEPKKGWQRILARAQALGFVHAVAKAAEWNATQREEAEALALEDAEVAFKKYAALAKRHHIKAAELALTDLRIHDLRRTLGSWQAKMGASLSVIGKSLNHRNVATTQIYARLDQDPIRESVSRATSAMLEAGGMKKKADVLTLATSTK